MRATRRGTPPWAFYALRQVSWLAGLRYPSGLPSAFTPVTLSTATRRLQLRGQRRNHTCFPLGFRFCVIGRP